MRKNRCSARLVFAAAFALAAAPIDAQNLVRNGTFDTDVSDWPTGGPAAQVSWSPQDANGSPSSGSALIANVSTGPSNGEGIQQCVSGPGIVAGVRYTYGGKVRIPSGQARTGFVMFGLRWYASPDCSGNAEDQPRVDTRVLGAWVSLEDVSVAPAGSRSVEVLAFPSKAEAGGELHALFDDIFLLPGSPPDDPLLGLHPRRLGDLLPHRSLGHEPLADEQPERQRPFPLLPGPVLQLGLP